MKEKIKKIKIQYTKLIQWLKSHPKEVFKYSLIFLIISFTASILQYFIFPSKGIYIIEVPALYSKSSNAQEKELKKEEKMARIIHEMQKYKEKREKGILTKSDSVRIDYLFNQFQNLRNGN